MYRYPDGTIRQTPPARVEYDGYVRSFADLSLIQRDEIGYNEAVPIKREPFTAYETGWVKGEDLVYRETIIISTVDLEAKEKEMASSIRNQRNVLLSECDWTQLYDVDLSDEDKNKWKEYRQSLRNITEQDDFPFNIEWPSAPTK
jgi:hypothetical protein